MKNVKLTDMEIEALIGFIGEAIEESEYDTTELESVYAKLLPLAEN